MALSADDHRFMAHAMQLAERGRYTTRPNPRVGCVLVNDAKVIAEGWHYLAGHAHAEVHALAQAQAAAQTVAGATAYVTLEPCAHKGKTGACTDALIKAGIARVVYALEDPNPLVAGKGLALLSDAGIIVDGPVLESAAIEINQGFICRMRHQRPWVRCKIAASLDGATAMENGESQWITGAPARQDVQRLRAQSCAVVTGVGSIAQDNSRLSIRAQDLPAALLESGVDVDDILAKPPLRVVLDTTLRIAPDAAIFEAPGKVVIMAGTQACNEKAQQLLMRWPDKVSIERLLEREQQVDLPSVLSVLATQYECNDILVEAGAILSSAFIEQNLIDEMIIYQAPVLLGSTARNMTTLSLASLQDKIHLHISDRRLVGDDMRITARITPA